jgi:hypothetical protein
VVQQSVAARRPIEAPVIDMEQIWESGNVDVPQWNTIYAALCQGAMTAASLAKEGEDDSIDYEALASEADTAYSRLAARLTNSR